MEGLNIKPKNEIVYIKRGHALLLYIPYAIDKILIITMAGVIILGIFMPLEEALNISATGAIILVITYFIVARFTGKWDYFSGSYKNQAEIEYQNNPEWNKMIDRLKRIEKHLKEP